MNSPKKNKFGSKKSKRIRFVPLSSDISNTPLDSENSELANLIENKVSSADNLHKDTPFLNHPPISIAYYRFFEESFYNWLLLCMP